MNQIDPRMVQNGDMVAEVPRSCLGIVRTAQGIRAASIESIAYAGIAPKGYRFTGVWREDDISRPNPVQVFLLREQLLPLVKNLQSLTWETNPDADANLQTLTTDLKNLGKEIEKMTEQVTWGSEEYKVSEISINRIEYGQYDDEIFLAFRALATQEGQRPYYIVERVIAYSFETLQKLFFDVKRGALTKAELAGSLLQSLSGGGNWQVQIPESLSVRDLHENPTWFKPPFNTYAEDSRRLEWYWRGHLVRDVWQSHAEESEYGLFLENEPSFEKPLAKGVERVFSDKEVSLAYWRVSAEYKAIAAEALRQQSKTAKEYADVMDSVNTKVEIYKQGLLAAHAPLIQEHETLTQTAQEMESKIKGAWLFLWQHTGSLDTAKTSADKVLQVRVTEGITIVSEALAIEDLQKSKPELLKTVIDTAGLKKAVTKDGLALPTGVERKDTASVVWYTDKLLESY